MGFKLNKQKILNIQFILFLYRLFKVIYYKLIYDTFVYKFLYLHNISDVIDFNKKYRLVVCHNGGGGTVSYMKNKYFNDKDVLVLRNTITADKDYLYSIENVSLHKQCFIKPQKLSLLNKNLYEINIVAVESYMSLNFILPWFASLQLPITYDLHDYHCIWYETHFIHNGKYLTKEELKKSVLKYAGTKITFQQWHDIWQKFLSSVNQINAFSESSKEIFSEYYPEYINKVKVTPHSLEYITCNKLTTIPKNFNIGIFGIIKGADKGCYVIKSFLDFSKNKEYQIYINGELNSDCMIKAPNIHYMGRYDVSKLDKIIFEQGISTVLFPSICPETFSYTVSELIHVGIPIACFNLGAQAEKVSKYKYGEIIKENTNEEIFSALKKAYEKGQRKEDNNE